MHSWRKLAALFAGLLLVVGLASCGDDDDDTAVGADDSEEAAGEEGEESEESGDDDHMEEEGGGPEVNPCAEGVTPEEAGLPPAEEPADGATAVTVTGTEYSFEGADALAAGGSMAITFENEGAELHEIVIQSIDESETRSIEEMLESEEPPETVSMVAFGFACPGSSTVLNADLSAPGRYVVLCHVPVGTTPDTDPEEFERMGEDVESHAEQGMVFEFTVEG